MSSAFTLYDNAFSLQAWGFGHSETQALRAREEKGEADREQMQSYIDTPPDTSVAPGGVSNKPINDRLPVRTHYMPVMDFLNDQLSHVPLSHFLLATMSSFCVTRNTWNCVSGPSVPKTSMPPHLYWS